MDVNEMRSNAGRLGLMLQVKNNGSHWIFRATGLQWGFYNQIFAEWWPETGRLVFKKQFHKAVFRNGSHEAFAEIARRIPDIERRVVCCGPPAYLQRVKELVE